MLKAHFQDAEQHTACQEEKVSELCTRQDTETKVSVESGRISDQWAPGREELETGAG